MKPEEIMMMSADAALRTVSGKQFATAMKNSLTLVRDKVVSRLTPSDNPGLLIPVFVDRDGKSHPGVALALEDRLVIAWSTGTFRRKEYDAVIPRANIESVEHVDAPPTVRVSAVIITSGADIWVLKVPLPDSGAEKGIGPIFVGVLDGSLKPMFGDGS